LIATKYRWEKEKRVRDNLTKYFEEDEESNVVIDKWFTFRKRGLISPFGEGTIDQLFLSVLFV